MSWSGLASILVYVSLLSFLAYGGQTLQFTMAQYQVRLSNATSPGTVVQQVVALTNDSRSNITYSVQTNPHVEVNSLSGEVICKSSSIPSVIGYVGSYTVIAITDGGERTTSVLRLNTTTDLCSCAAADIAEIKVSRAENLPPQTLVYLQDSRCSADNGYQLDNDSKLMNIKNGRLIVEKLDFEDKDSKVAEGRLVCREDNRQVKVSVEAANQPDISPYTFCSKTPTFCVKHFNVDADQHTPFLLGGELQQFLIVDQLGSSDKWNVTTLNNPHNQLTACIDSDNAKPSTHPRRPGIFVPIVVTAANRTLITSSTDIDVIFTDGNIDIYGPSNDSIPNTVTLRFSLNYTDENALLKLKLENEYSLEVFNNSPINTPVLKVLDKMSKFLTFELATLPNADQGCKGFLDVTAHQGVVYVNNTEQLAACTGSQLTYNMTITQGDKAPRYTLLYLAVQPEHQLAANTTSIVSCSRYKYEKDCEASSGVGSLQCQWKVVQTKSSNYSTCVPSDSCADGHCSEYESLDKAICPQDCLDGSPWYHSATIKACDRSEGLCDHMSGVCYCNGDYHCVCTPEDLLDKANSTNTDTGGETAITEVCGIQCMVIIAVVLAVSILTIVLIVLWCKLKKTKLAANINDWRVNGNNINFNFTTVPDYMDNTPSTVISAFSDWPEAHPYLNTGNMEVYDEKWELSRENLIIGDFIGEGEFGRVLKAEYRESLLSDWVPVAVKMLKDGASRVEFGDLLSEYTLLKEVDHPNIIKLIGASTLNGPFHLVVEYCEHGSLKNYLRGVRTEEPIYVNGATQFYTEHAQQLMYFSSQISNGMQYLSEIKLVHRDLATRNILIASDMVIKISDFGMTKDIYEEDAYKKKGQGRIPVKWMAPESLYHQIYTTKSDVWSFGIVLWEIATLGATPYPGIPAERMYNLLHEGYRMDRPETCSVSLYTLMRKCWEYDPVTRPSFKELRHSLEKMVKGGETSLDLTVAAQGQRLCHGSSSVSTGSEDGSETQQLTVALLPSPESKFVADYLVSSVDQQACDEKSPLRYTTLEFTDDD